MDKSFLFPKDIKDQIVCKLRGFVHRIDCFCCFIISNFDQNIMSRQSKFEIYTRIKYKIGGNIPKKRIQYENNRILLNYLNLNFRSFKIEAKKIFLKQRTK